MSKLIDHIFTSSFFNTKNLSFNKNNFYCISIATYQPKGFSYESIPMLAPNPAWIKIGKSNPEEYTKLYMKKLNHIGIDKVKSVLRDRLMYAYNQHGIKNIVLLCWEPRGSFCHRHLLMKFLGITDNYELPWYR